FDNGTEYLNEQFIAFCREHNPPIPMSRSRAYRKNDNAHVEQKNWTHVRQLLGYERFKDPRLVALLNDLYKKYWCPFHNFFQPSAKLAGKTRVGSRYRKRYDPPTTPCDRLLKSPWLSDQQKAALTRTRDRLDPFLLKQQIEEKLNQIFAIVAADTGSGHAPDPMSLDPVNPLTYTNLKPVNVTAFEPSRVSSFFEATARVQASAPRGEPANRKQAERPIPPPFSFTANPARPPQKPAPPKTDAPKRFPATPPISPSPPQKK